MRVNKLINFINLLLILVTSNSFFICKDHPAYAAAFVLGFIIVNLTPSLSLLCKMSKRLRLCWHGTSVLRLFQISVFVSLILHAYLLIAFPLMWLSVLISALVCALTHAVFFWNGMISLYISSVQLGIKERVVGALCGMIPVVNLVILNRMLKITTKEVFFELEKEQLNRNREDEQMCKTKYPILMVHGVFFRDNKKLNYWGRIPQELEKNGATIYYGNHQSASSVENSAAELSARIKQIVADTGAEKVNVIAHSKGGLDMRYAIENCDIRQYVASLITVNSPHRGCKFADYLLEKAPEKLRNSVANTYNSAFRRLGDTNPDFLCAARDLTSAVCLKRDEDMPVPENIYCLSVGSKLKKATNGKFPLNLTYHLVNLFDGPNDGLVGKESFKWSDNYIFLDHDGDRGLSHGDMIDLNRENIDGFDVREFYVNLVSKLKKMDL